MFKSIKNLIQNATTVSINVAKDEKVRQCAVLAGQIAKTTVVDAAKVIAEGTVLTSKAISMAGSFAKASVANQMQYKVFQSPSFGMNGFDYELVYTGKFSMTDSRFTAMTDEELLEMLFCILNNEHPSDYTARSLSVGDLVEIRGKGYAVTPEGFVPFGVSVI